MVFEQKFALVWGPQTQKIFHLVVQMHLQIYLAEKYQSIGLSDDTCAFYFVSDILSHLYFFNQNIGTIKLEAGKN